MNYFKTKIRNDVFDYYSSNVRKFSDLDEDYKFEIIKDYLLMWECSICSSMQYLLEPESALNCFKLLYNLDVDLPDDSDDQLDLLFINFICLSPKTYLMKTKDIFTDSLIESVEDFVDEIFEFYTDASNQDYCFGYGRKEKMA